MSDQGRINENINDLKLEMKKDSSDIKYDFQNRLNTLRYELYKDQMERETNSAILNFGLLVFFCALSLTLISKKPNNQKKAEKESHSAFVFSSK